MRRGIPRASVTDRGSGRRARSRARPTRGRPIRAPGSPCVSSARSPRIVPGAASRGLVAPIRLRTTFHVSATALDHHRDQRAAGDERHEVAEERLAPGARRSDGPRGRRRCVRCSSATIVRPLRSMRADDLADESRSTASGLQRTSVRVLMGSLRRYARAAARSVDEHGSRAGARRRRASRRRRTWSSAVVASIARRPRHCVGDTVDDLDRSGSTPSSRAASATSSRVARARDLGTAAHDHAVALAHTERIEHLVRVLLPEDADDPRAHARRRRGNSSSSAARTACAPATFFVPSITTSGSWPDDLESSRRAAPTRTRPTTTVAAERLDRGTPPRRRARPRRCRPGARRAAGRTRRRTTRSGVNRSSTRPPTASRFVAHAEVDVAYARPCRGRGR